MTAAGHTYSASQVDQYLGYIGLRDRADDRFGFLDQLVKLHRATVPFECLDLHYTQEQRLSLDPEALFRKVLDRRRGGYCMEMNNFFGAVLRSLGFTVTSVSGRVRLPTGDYTGLTHMVNLVTLDDVKYLVDVGFGAYGPTGPLALTTAPESQPGTETAHADPQPAFGPFQMRLQHRPLPLHTDRSQRVWVYSHTMDPRHTTDPDGWLDTYAFTEAELFPADYGVLNLWTMTSPDSLFVRCVVAQIMLLDPDTQETIGFTTLLDNTLKVRVAGRPEEVHTFSSEDDRRRALATHFGVHLTDAECQAIRGRATDLGSA